MLLRPVTGNPFTTAGHSDSSYLMKCHRGFLKHNINIVDVLTVCFTKGFTSHVGKGRQPQVARGPRNVTTVLGHSLSVTVKNAYVGRAYLSYSHCITDELILMI
jgi:hypothetical protein